MRRALSKPLESLAEGMLLSVRDAMDSMFFSPGILEQMIAEQRVTVNGEVAHVGQRVSFGDRIAIDGKPVRVRIAPPPPRVIAYHKPVGEVVSHDDPQNRPTVFRKLVPWLLLGATALFALCAVAAPSVSAIELSPVLSGLSSPVLATHAGDGSRRLFVVEQVGRIRVLQPGATTPTTFLDISTRLLAGGERGLLGLAFHPQYAANGRFFVFYTRSGDGALTIAEYRASADPNVAGTAETVLADPRDDYTRRLLLAAPSLTGALRPNSSRDHTGDRGGGAVFDEDAVGVPEHPSRRDDLFVGHQDAPDRRVPGDGVPTEPADAGGAERVRGDALEFDGYGSSRGEGLMQT